MPRTLSPRSNAWPRSCSRLLACLLTVTLLAGAARAAQPVALRAGLARADITPDPAMLNWTVVPARPYGEVHDPLFARAFVLTDDQTRLVILSWDLLDAREYAVQRVRAAISSATGIPAAHIVVQATHNHSGPKSEMYLNGPLLARERHTSQPPQEGPTYRAWADRLVDTCVDLVRQAITGLQPVTLGIARAYAGEWLYNRRPVRPDGTVISTLLPRDPYVLPGGQRFGTVDPTMTILSVRKPGGANVATLFHVPMHVVAAYSGYKGISGDWPSRLAQRLQGALGGEAMFLQGCAGDIVPARRGFEAIEAMTALLAERALNADKVASPLEPGTIRVARAVVGAAATEAAARDLGQETIPCEVMVITCGPLALVTLPGEPLQEIGTAIQQRSPYPHTLVLGYANGRGVGYVGLPGGKVKGGYEMSEVGAGADEAGALLVETAVRLLKNPVTAPDQRRS